MTDYLKVNGSIVLDFAKRTLANLMFIEAHKQQPNVYEVTQMINSLLGLLVFPKEEFWNNIKREPLANIPYTTRINIRQDTYTDRCTDLRTLVRHIRNSISHFGIEFVADRNYISRIEMSDELIDRKNGKVIAQWTAEMSVFDLRDFAVWFIEGIIDSTLLEIPIEKIA